MMRFFEIVETLEKTSADIIFKNSFKWKFMMRFFEIAETLRKGSGHLKIASGESL